jgi:FAD/FMN-containing dehydrogenase
VPARPGPRPGHRLTRPRLPPLPHGFRGAVLEAEGAEKAASRVSGPFRMSPAAYLSPTDPEDLALLVRWAGEHGVALTPRGSGTGMPGGNLGPSVVVSLAEGEGFRDLAPVEGQEGGLRTGAAVVASRADGAARSGGRCLPPLPSSAPWCSLGGMAANNAAGARSFRYGAAAAWVTALEGIDARGEPFRLEAGGGGSGTLPSRVSASLGELDLGELDDTRAPVRTPRQDGAWPRVRKNASGYALDRYAAHRDPLQLLVGSEGTLAFLTSVEWRTAPLPPGRGVALLPARSPDDVVALALGAREVGASACEFLGRWFLELAGLADDPLVGEVVRGADSILLLEVEGAPEEVESRLAACAALGRDVAGPGIVAAGDEEARRLWSLRHAASPIIAREAGRGRISTQFIEDCVVPVDRLGEHLESLEAILAEARFDAVIFGHAGDGNLHVNPLVDVGSSDWPARVRWTLDRVAALVRHLGGTLSGEHGDGRVRAPYLESVWGADLTGAFRKVKDAFDPDGILNPGVILPLPGQDPLDGLVPRSRAFPTRSLSS